MRRQLAPLLGIVLLAACSDIATTPAECEVGTTELCFCDNQQSGSRTCLASGTWAQCPACDGLDGGQRDQGGADTPTTDRRVDFSGAYFVWITAGLGDLFLAIVVDVEPDLSTVSFTLQPLTQESPHTPTGDTFEADDVLFDREGRFAADFRDVVIPPSASPTGGRLVGDLTLVGTVTGDDDFCGLAEGDIDDPFPVQLNGTFGATSIDEGESRSACN